MSEDNVREVQKPKDGSDGAVGSKVHSEAQEDRSTASAMTDKASLDKLTSNLSTLDPKREGGNITVALNSPYQGALTREGLLGAPPAGDGQPKPGGDGKGGTKPATDAQGLIKTDGKIDLPPKPENMSAADYERMSKAVEALNKNLNDPKNQLTDQQRKNIERSAEQMLGNKNLDGSDRRPPLDPKEATKVLEQANIMFEKRAEISQNFKGQLSDARQNQLIDSMTYSVANPNRFNQGANNTCNVTASEKAEMMQKPGAQAERFVSMYTSKDGFVSYPDGNGGKFSVQIDRASLIPNREADFADKKPGSGARNAYAQALNHGDVNAVTQQHGEFYTSGAREFNGDTGERLHKGSFAGAIRRRDDGRIENSPAFGVDDVDKLLKMTGTGHIAADQDRFGGRRGAGIINVDAGDPKSLDRAWEQNGGKPMVIAVDTNSDMFRSATDVGGKTKGGGHVITLVDRRESPPGSGKYEYLSQNSWGDPYNGWVSGDAVASAMNPRKGDRSGNTGQGDGGGSAENWGEQRYRRPKDGGTSGGAATQGDGSGYGWNNKPQRDADGIKSGDQYKQELDQRKKIMEEEEQRLKDAQKKRALDEQEKQLLESIQKQKDLLIKQEEEEKKRQERLRRMNGGDSGGKPQ